MRWIKYIIYTRYLINRSKYKVHNIKSYWVDYNYRSIYDSRANIYNFVLSWSMCPFGYILQLNDKNLIYNFGMSEMWNSWWPWHSFKIIKSIFCFKFKLRFNLEVIYEIMKKGPNVLPMCTRTSTLSYLIAKLL